MLTYEQRCSSSVRAVTVQIPKYPRPPHTSGIRRAAYSSRGSCGSSTRCPGGHAQPTHTRYTHWYALRSPQALMYRDSRGPLSCLQPELTPKVEAAASELSHKEGEDLLREWHEMVAVYTIEGLSNLGDRLKDALPDGKGLLRKRTPEGLWVCSH